MISDMQEYQKINSCKNIIKVNLDNIRKVKQLKSIDNIDINQLAIDYEYDTNVYLCVIDGDDIVYYLYNGYKWVPANSDYVLCSQKSLIDEWRNCLSSGKLKLLKSPNGYMWIVAISD